MTSYPYQLTLFVSQKISCVLSMTGSIMIISQVTRSKFNRSKPQQRIILGISICDVCVSSIWLFTNLFVPPWSGMILAMGNQASCDAQGFIIQCFNSTGIMYMVGLQIQYLLTIKYGWKQPAMLKIEPYMHGIPPFLGLATAAVALALNLINPAGWNCWIAPYPPDCTSTYEIQRGFSDVEVTDCMRGDNAAFYQWGFFYAPLWFAIIFCSFVMIAVIIAVKTAEERGSRWSNSQSGEPGELKYTKEVTIQCLMYAGTFLAVWTFPTIARLMQLFRIDTHPILFVLSGTFVSCQGFFNAITYFRPRYLKSKEKGFSRRVWSIMRSTLFFFCHHDDVTKDMKDVVSEENFDRDTATNTKPHNTCQVGTNKRGEVDAEGNTRRRGSVKKIKLLSTQTNSGEKFVSVPSSVEVGDQQPEGGIESFSIEERESRVRFSDDGKPDEIFGTVVAV